MRQQSHSAAGLVSGVVLAVAVIASGCAGRHAVVAMSSTTIGVVVHQNEKQQTPEMKVGYNREEFAYVPTNRSGEDNATASNSLGDGAKDTGNVIMEIRGGGSVGLSAVGQGEIYQRLAVGDIAVAQPGAAFMVAKDASGKLDSNTAAAVSLSVQSLQEAAVRVEKKTASIEDIIKYATVTGTNLVDVAKLKELAASTGLKPNWPDRYQNVPVNTLRADLTGIYWAYVPSLAANLPKK